MRSAAAWSGAGLLCAAALAALIAIAWLLRAAVVPTLLAVLLTALLEPIARRIIRATHSRALGAALSCLALIVVVLGVLWLAVRALARSAASIASALRNVKERLGGGALGNTLQNTASGVDDLGHNLGGSLAQGAVHGLSLAAQLLTTAILTGFLTFFMLRDSPRIPGVLRTLAPARHGELLVRVVRGSYRAAAGYMRGTTMIAAIDAVFICLGLFILRVHGAAGLAVLVFFGAYIPFVGAFLSGLISVLVALGDRGLVTALWTLGVVLAVQFIEGNFLQPGIQSRTVSLHPAAIVLIVTAGTSLGGITGAVLAVPIAAAAIAVAAELRTVVAGDPPAGEQAGAD
jgi:predicted PurR-regulated permease PerM